LAQTAITGESQLVNQFLTRESTDNQLALQFAPIHSVLDVNRILLSSKVSGTAFDKLSPAAKQRFLASLTFNENGLTGFSYADIERELTPSDIYQLLSLFGVQRLAPTASKGARIDTATDALIHASPMTCGPGHTVDPGSGGCDHDGYRCQSRGTCLQTMQAICTSNC